MAILYVGINGFGRIGRSVTRAMHARGELSRLKAVVDVADAANLAYLLKHDSVQGQFPDEVHALDNAIGIGRDSTIANGWIRVLQAQKSPADVPWDFATMEGERLLVIESTGRFTEPSAAGKHKAGHVLITQPAKGDPDLTVVFGANENSLNFDSQRVFSLASCTTNSIARALKALNLAFGIERGWLTTFHAYTSDQALHDSPHKDFRRGRAAGRSMVPTSTGAAKAIGLVLPELAGKLDGMAVRTSNDDGSLSQLTLVLGKSVTVKDVNEVLRQAAEESPTILGYTTEPLVSVDIVGDARSGVVDSLLTSVVGGTLVNVSIWYDNEWGFSNRVVDFIKRLAQHVEGA